MLMFKSVVLEKIITEMIYNLDLKKHKDFKVNVKICGKNLDTIITEFTRIKDINIIIELSNQFGGFEIEYNGCDLISDNTDYFLCDILDNISDLYGDY